MRMKGGNHLKTQKSRKHTKTTQRTRCENKKDKQRGDDEENECLSLIGRI